MIARRLDDCLGTHAVWLTPYVVAGPAIIATFQAGNVQMATIALTLLAMSCFERRLHALGGALLALAIAAKLYPGVFVLYLLLRRDWRPSSGRPGSAPRSSWCRSRTSAGHHTAPSCTRCRG